MTLLTAREKVLKSIKDLVSMQIPAHTLTKELIRETAGVWPSPGPWYQRAVRAARRELLGHQSRSESAKPPEGVRGVTLPGGWVDLDADGWDLRSGGGSYLKRNRLRSDLADIAWTRMREELLEGQLACGTIAHHYDGYRWAGELLGSEVPDVREATLERVQRAWISYGEKPIKRQSACAALRRIFAGLYNRSAEVSGIDRREMLIISGWLYTSASVRLDAPKEDFLSETEMDAVIASCLIDVKAGLDFTERNVDLLDLPTRTRAKDNAAVVVNWASALMLLLMLFTGLRRESVINLGLGDLVELRPGLFALVWTHGKKREQKVAVLATAVALLINSYIRRTADLRRALGTENVFLTRTRNAYWGAGQGKGYLQRCLQDFTKRHGIVRDENLLHLSSTILRRTYVTRELYMGRSIWALRLQLGHSSIRTTRRYGKFDLFEHPAEVGAALDEYGRRSLTLWHRPLLLAELEPAERDGLLGIKEVRDQDVGLCRHDGCIKISIGGLPPCSLCEHLVTGPEFLKAWDVEQRGREAEMEELRSTPGAGQLLAQQSSQYEVFKMNRAFVMREERP
jgi:integrase